MKNLIVILFYIGFIACVSCSSDDNDPDPAKPAVSDPELVSIVAQFKSDAAANNVTVNENIVAVFTDDASKPYMSYFSGSYREGNTVFVFIVKSRFDQYGGKYTSAVYRELGEQILHKEERLECNINDLSFDLMCTMYCPCNDGEAGWDDSVKYLFN